MFSKEPHISLLRVEFSFDHKLDEAFQIDIKKSQIILNEALYDHVLDFLTPPRRAAAEVNRKGMLLKTADISKSAHDSSNRNISVKEDEISKPAIQSVDPTKNEAELVNKQGPVRLKLKISSPAKPTEVHIQPVPSINDGLLWEPCLIDKHCGVQINTSHPYYRWLSFMNRGGLGCIIADEMGLGKTVQVICLILEEVQAGHRPNLVVAPATPTT